MKPYYQDSFVTLYHGDCMDIEEWRKADVLVTDPPYGISWAGWRGKESLIANDENTSIRDSMLELWEVNKPAIIFGNWRIPRPERTKSILIWEKGNHTGLGNLNHPWRPCTEEIYVSGKWPKREAKGRGGGGRVSNVLSYMATAKLSEKQGRLHPTEKPIALLTELVSKSPPGIIADPFCGAGATLVAAKNLSRFAIGVELNEKYCEITARRLQEITR